LIARTNVLFIELLFRVFTLKRLLMRLNRALSRMNGVGFIPHRVPGKHPLSSFQSSSKIKDNTNQKRHRYIKPEKPRRSRTARLLCGAFYVA